MKRKIRMGMVGGGPGAFIGDVHRRAARLNGDIELVAGVFGTDVAKSRECGKDLFLDPARVYPNYQDMVAGELKLPADKRIDFVAVVTPNRMHYPISKAFLEGGFHVLCEKPISMSSKEAVDLKATLVKTGKLFALMHNYTGYPMVKQARQMVADGALGTVRKINVEYSLGWLAAPNAGKQAAWRVTPSEAGISGCMADIGTHAQNLIHYVTGLDIVSLNADLATFVPGRALDDDGSVMLRFNNGARGVIFASEVATGEENNFVLKIYGDKAGLEWRQESPENLIFRTNDAPMQVYRRNWAGVGPVAQKASHLPAGHPEGFLEAFANIYRAFADAIIASLNGVKNPGGDFPGIDDGISEMRFLEALVKSSADTSKWVTM
ncbi:MAG TPA: Gfo/Idh/MocA family oxidoreductase [Lentisphaeria bacterium]|nr:MAG: putative oxidoreductase YcjS [Lentisphaerae bacterium ADurb.Bin082]HPY89180.1 Gfo/Idh/MocA family oxidoreductase [Lentisphaeria bacterium]HQL87853.1 Gfo/Idh/MocA family oxidoreductase [Lentisphaeria bacterium]